MKRVLASKLWVVPATGDEIRRLVQAFLEARREVVPRPRRPLRQLPTETSDDSQDYFDDEIDPMDPELEAALGGGLTPEQQEIQQKDARVSEVGSPSLNKRMQYD